ncbi:MAG: hypothetical protein J6N76_04080, partial [Lachnospiraceae bacterium]|nr:hypothetical protein [Lachnospiraceae bacterium]
MNKIVKGVIAGVVAVAAVAGGLVYYFYPESVAVESAQKSDITMSISENGNVSADDAVTQYAPVAGRLGSVKVKVNDMVKSGVLLATYDTEVLESNYEKAALNTEYYQDGYNAAVNENNKNAAKMQEATAAAEALKQQYVSTREGMDAITEDQNNENNSIAASLNSLQANLDNTQIAMEAEKAKLERAEEGYTDAKLNELISNIQSYRNQIAALPV